MNTHFYKCCGGGKMFIVLLYIDDFIFTKSNNSMCEYLKRFMMIEFDMSNMNLMQYFRSGAICR